MPLGQVMWMSVQEHSYKLPRDHWHSKRLLLAQERPLNDFGCPGNRPEAGAANQRLQRASIGFRKGDRDLRCQLVVHMARFDCPYENKAVMTKKKAPAKRKAAAKRPAAKKTMLRQSLTHSSGRLKAIGDTGPHAVRTIPPRRQVQRVRERLPTPQEVREGIDTDTLGWLRDWLQVSDAELNEVLRISRSTRRRREESGSLTHEEGDRAANVLRAIVKAVD